MSHAWVKGYRELKVYQLAFQEAMQLYWLLPQVSVEGEDLLGQKIVDGSRLVCASLAEAWGQRRCYETVVAKLNEAEMGAAAVQTWLAFAMECGYVELTVGQEHWDRYEAILREMGELMAAMAGEIELAA